jgi:Phospholipase_D-nuclease N-terminal
LINSQGARNKEVAMFFFLQEGFTYRNFLVDAVTIFIFIVWFWLLISVFRDLFRRHDISGWGKAIWVIALIIFPYITVFVYLIAQGRGIAERDAQAAQQARDELRRVVGFSAADEIEKLDRLKKAGSISNDEFRCLRAKLVQ